MANLKDAVYVEDNDMLPPIDSDMVFKGTLEKTKARCAIFLLREEGNELDLLITVFADTARFARKEFKVPVLTMTHSLHTKIKLNDIALNKPVTENAIKVAEAAIAQTLLEELEEEKEFYDYPIQ